MGIMSKIEDKLSGSSKDQNTLQKEQYDSNTSSTGNSSSLQHPISGSKPTGTAVSSGDDGYGSQSGTYGNQTGSYGSQPNTYSSNQPGAFDSKTTSDRMPGGYESGNQYSSGTTTSSTAPRQEYESPTGPRQPYDPYSRKGQQTAAAGAMPGSGTTQTSDYGRSGYEDPSVARGKTGGVLNQTDQQRYTSGSQPTSTTTSSGHPVSSASQYQSQPTSQHHYGRDAAMAGGVGAGGVGAYELGKHQQTTTAGQPQDPSYMNRSAGGTQYDPNASRSMEDPSMASGASPSSGVPGESPGLTQARKMGGAYEAGYRDAMEHMKAEMQK